MLVEDSEHVKQSSNFYLFMYLFMYLFIYFICISLKLSIKPNRVWGFSPFLLRLQNFRVSF